MPESGYESQVQSVQRDSTKIYFFVVAIVALLATNIYFYVQYKSTNEVVDEITHEKISLQAEVDRIEIELNRLDAENMRLSGVLKSSRDSAHRVIADLRDKLNAQTISQEEIVEARQQIDELRAEVYQYAGEIEVLRRENTELLAEQGRLRQSVSDAELRADSLEEENFEMAEQLRVASALKVSNISVVGVRERSRGREEPETRTRRVDRLDINFTIADNPLASHGMVDVYVRIIDPNGNLRTPTGSDFFQSGTSRLQYTYKTTIEFSNDGKLYSLDWRDSQPFQKGTYTVLLYSDQGAMGRSSIVLR